jgi:hypothetical protein
MKRPLRRMRRHAKELTRLLRLRANRQGRWESFMLTPQTHLAGLCDAHGSDKGSLRPDAAHPYAWPPHSYTEVYDLLLRPLRRHARWVLECGIGTNDPALPSSMGERGRPGASLRVWRDYFPAARIIGIDIDERILFTEERIETYAVDQTSADSIARFLSRLPEDARFDLIIDDGLHTPQAAFSLFTGVSQRLAEDGIYVIEDVALATIPLYGAFFAGLAEDFAARVFVLHRAGQEIRDNCLLVVTRRDRLWPEAR